MSAHFSTGTLSPVDRAIYKRAMIQAGKPTAGLTDAQLQAAYDELTGAKPKPKPKPAPKAEPKAPAPVALPDTAAQLMALAKQLADEAKAQKSSVSESRIVELIEQHAPRILRELLASMLKGA